VSKDEHLFFSWLLFCVTLVDVEKYFCVFFKGIVKKSWKESASSFFVNTEHFLYLHMNLNIYVKARALSS